MDSTLAFRALGATLGSVFGVALIAAGLLLASPGGATEATLAFGFIVLVLGAILGAAFGPRAAQPGIRSGLLTSAWVTALAVPLGAIGVAVSMFPGTDTVSSTDFVAVILAIAFVGLLYLGLPMAGLTYVVANIWVVLVRLAGRILLRSSTVSDRGSRGGASRAS